MPIPVVQVDAFTRTSFTGNPAAVCVVEAPLPDDRLQQVAREMNCSETAFLARRDEAAFDLRWFTPTHEVDLCGHATLASAHVLWSDAHVADDASIDFHTLSGVLTATPGEDGTIALDFPAEPVMPIDAPDGLLDALDVDPVGVYQNRMDLLVHVADAWTVRDLDPDMQRLATIDTRGIIVTATADASMPDADFVSRFFGPRVGVPEDPVTGSAHCALGPFWSDRLNQNQNPLVGRQVSARGGRVEVEVRGDRVTLRGHAVTTLRGEIVGTGE